MAKVPLRVYNREIETMIDRGLLDEAVAHCRHILKTFPKHLETYRLLGKAYLEYKRYPDAADIFSRVLVSVPSDFVANVGMSIIRDEENSLDDAIWHMERAFETQPSNAAIQSELQRLYARRDGVAPPRIRMTRGALAHMYVQGELYPQAISEIKAVLKDDPARTDMQSLLARAYYRSGLKNDAAEVATTVLRMNPYNLDANRVLVDILGLEHPESVLIYRQHVIELDPYASQVTSSIFLSDEVPDNAVTVERLDWNGQPVGMQPDWETRQAIGLESGTREEQPDWLKGTFGETTPSQPASVPPFEAAAPSTTPAEPAEEIPEFLRAAGWGKATGAFDESKSAFTEAEHEAAPAEPPLEQGELPDWVKALAPQQPAETPAEEEELPDWINQIGTSALPISSKTTDQVDWMNQPAQPAAQPTEEEPDWLKQIGKDEQPAVPQAEEPGWLKQMAEEEQPAASAEEPDWLKGFANETEPAAPEAKPSTGELDWLSQLTQESKSQPEAAAPMEEFDFLNPLGSARETKPAEVPSEEFDFLNELTEETRQPTPASSEIPTQPTAPASGTGISEAEQEDAFAWLESLAAKQGATEGLLTKPEERREEEPDWIKQAKGLDVTQPIMKQEEEPPVTEPAKSVEELGKSEQEFDDSFAWLESLAAKQGATEGLLTKPEERREEEPEWVRQAKSLGTQPQKAPSAQAPEEEQPAVTEPAALEESAAKGTEEDAFAWLESLAAKQGATEGLLTKPEERPAEEPEWVKQAREEAETPAEAPEAPVAEQPVSADDTASWLHSLEEEFVSEEEPVRSKDDTAVWFMKLEATEEAPAQPAESVPAADLPEWMRDIEEEKAAGLEEEFTFPAAETPSEVTEREPSGMPEVSEWMSTIEQESAMEAGAPLAEQPAEERPEEELPSWLSDLVQEPERATTPSLGDEGLPAWLRDETGELVAEPTRIEPTRASDWQRLEVETSQPETEPVMEQPEVQAPEPVAPSAPEPVALEAVAPSAEVEAVEPEPAVAISQPEPEPVNVVAMIEEKIVAAEQEPEKPAVPPRGKEPVRKVTGPLTDPVLGQARSELSRSNLSGAVDNYARLIRKGRFLEDIIYDLREALYRYPVDIGLWQSLGDAYMRSNRLQDALDAYTKAEELLR